MTAISCTFDRTSTTLVLRPSLSAATEQRPHKQAQSPRIQGADPMPRPKKAVDDSEQLQLDAFAKQVEAAILHYGDPQWLGRNSPLAQPWVLGALLQDRGESEIARGQLLRDLILEAVGELTDDEQRRVIIAGYINRNPHLTNAGVALREGMNERQFFRKRAIAVRKIAQWLYRRLLSPLRLETPPRQPLAGRHSERTLMLETLRAGKSVYVAGPSGIGKSTLAAEVAHEMHAAVFWYTIRPGSNDNLESLVFALAWFMRQQGAHNLWLQIVADSQDLESERIAGLLRYDLSTLPAGTFVLCIDEVDLLDADNLEHARVLHALEIMRAHAPLLLVGQRTVLETDTLVNVGALSEEDLAEWHRTIGSAIEVSLGQLMRQTQGIPVLLAAWLLLARSDPRYVNLVDDGKPITLESAFHRVWRRISELERLLIGELAVHGGTAPVEMLTFGVADAQGIRQTIQRLHERTLITELSVGSVQLPAYLVHLVEQYLDRETLGVLHIRVANALQSWGQHMDAVQHWLAGGKTEAAVWLWFRYREQEIARGNATRAVGLLSSINPETLVHDNDRVALQIALAELYYHLGRTDEGAAVVAPELPTTPAVRGHIERLRGDVAETLGNLEQSLAHYRTSLDTLLGETEGREAILRGRIIALYRNRLPNLAEARKQALLFRMRAERHYALVETLLGNYEDAERSYATALALASEVPDAKLERVRIASAIGMLLGTLGRYDEAIPMIADAVAHLEEIDSILTVLSINSNLAYFCMKSGDPQRAFDIAVQDLPRVRRTRESSLISHVAATAADAALAMGNLDDAERFAVEAIQQEEAITEHWALGIYALVHARRGDHPTAQMLAQQALDSAQETDNPYSIGYCERVLGEVYQAAQQEQQAREWYQRARTTYENVGLGVDAAEVDALMGSLGVLQEA